MAHNLVHNINSTFINETWPSKLKNKNLKKKIKPEIAYFK